MALRPFYGKLANNEDQQQRPNIYNSETANFHGMPQIEDILWVPFVIYVYLCYTVVSVPCSLMIICWEMADLLALLCVVCHFPLSVPGQLWYFIVSISDFCRPLYYILGRLMRISSRRGNIL